jgi:hypothetical protein
MPQIHLLGKAALLTCLFVLGACGGSKKGVCPAQRNMDQATMGSEGRKKKKKKKPYSLFGEMGAAAHRYAPGDRIP